MTLQISSIKNPRIKDLLNLQKPRERRQSSTFVIEGIREISLAQQSGYELVSLFRCNELYKEDSEYPIDLLNIEEIEITKEVYEKIAYRESTGGIIAIAKAKKLSIDILPKKDNPLYIVVEKVEKPGNIGAILRTADAAGVNGVIICDPATDFYNPNVIRSSVGCVFTVPIAATSNDELLSWFRSNHINSIATFLTARKSYAQIDYTKGTAILMGSEAQGLSEFWQQNADEKVIIPMKGKIDSMNVSNAAAIVVFEACRQRDFN